MDGFEYLQCINLCVWRLNCHNKHERSWTVNGNQMPVCVRDVGIFAGLALGGLIYSRRGVNRWTIRDTFLSILPDDRLQPVYRSNRRTMVFIAVGLICVVPLALDGFTQLLTDRESTAFLRLSRVYRLALDSDSFRRCVQCQAKQIQWTWTSPVTRKRTIPETTSRRGMISRRHCPPHHQLFSIFRTGQFS